MLYASLVCGFIGLVGFVVITCKRRKSLLQAMVNDVLEVHEESYEYEIETNSGKQKKQVLLNENDALWTHFRHIHISDTIDTITAKFKEHMKTQGAQLAKGEIQDISSMADGVRQLAQYQEQAGKLAQHMQMADACMDYFQKRKLHQLAMLEQTMATGVTNEGKKPKLAQLTNDLDQMLRSDEVGLSEKVRLLAMFIITQEGIQERDRKMLMKVVHQKHPNIVENGKEEAALLNLQHLGVTLQRSGGRKSQSKAALKKAKARAMEEGGYSLSRFVPVIKEMTQVCRRYHLARGRDDDLCSLFYLLHCGAESCTRGTERERVSLRRAPA